MDVREGKLEAAGANHDSETDRSNADAAYGTAAGHREFQHLTVRRLRGDVYGDGVLNSFTDHAKLLRPTLGCRELVNRPGYAHANAPVGLFGMGSKGIDHD